MNPPRLRAVVVDENLELEPVEMIDRATMHHYPLLGQAAASPNLGFPAVFHFEAYAQSDDRVATWLNDLVLIGHKIVAGVAGMGFQGELSARVDSFNNDPGIHESFFAPLVRRSPGLQDTILDGFAEAVLHREAHSYAQVGGYGVDDALAGALRGAQNALAVLEGAVKEINVGARRVESETVANDDAAVSGGRSGVGYRVHLGHLIQWFDVPTLAC